MFKHCLNYFAAIVITIILGLLSRHFHFVPLFIGDVLWATMVYFIVRMLFIRQPMRLAAILSLIFCYSIEFSQLYKAPWIDHLRNTLFGRLVLGETFLWGDLVSYKVGIGLKVGLIGGSKKSLSYNKNFINFP